MTINISFGNIPRFTQIEPVIFNVGAGVASWIDTDVSATTGLNPNRRWLVGVRIVGTQVVGIRPLGSAIDTSLNVVTTFIFISGVSLTGHVELWRNAAVGTDYVFLGYFN